ncbi:MAG: hypothetical protein ACODAE_00950 [Gemmatimonadota bacterium]
MRDRALERLYDGLLAGAEPEDRSGCPSPEELRALVEREGPEGERLSVLDHVMSCPSCRREFELLRATASARSRSLRPGRRWSRAGLAAAAVIALLVGGPLVWRLADVRDGPSEVMRGEEEAVRVIGPIGVVSEPPTALTWRSLPGAVRYAVDLVDRDGRAIVSEETRDTTLVLTDAAQLADDREYLWWVEAIRLDGTRVRSEPQRFAIQP